MKWIDVMMDGQTDDDIMDMNYFIKDLFRPELKIDLRKEMNKTRKHQRGFGVRSLQMFRQYLG